MKALIRSRLLVGFICCSVGAGFAQANHGETIYGFGNNVYQYNVGSATKNKLTGSGSWLGQYCEGSEQSVAVGGYGTMRLYGYSQITALADGADCIAQAHADAYANDVLSITGLTSGEAATLALEIECIQCMAQADVSYSLSVFTTCSISKSSTSPRCTVLTPVSYNGATGEPVPIAINRGIVVDADTDSMNTPAGATVTTGVCVGYVAAGCGSNGATVKASVVGPNGKAIKGTKVVGASGHHYN